VSERSCGSGIEPSNPEVFARSLAIVRGLAVAWVLMLGVGALMNQMPGALRAANALGADRALFTAVNASTLTGFTQAFAMPDDFAFMPRLVFLMQILSGLCLSLIGGGVLVARLIGARHTDRQVAVTALVMIGFSALIGAATLRVDESFLTAVTRGVGALAGAGLTAGAVRETSNLWLHVILLPMSFVGGLGTVAILELWRALVHRECMSRHALTAFAVTAGVYIVGVLLIAPLLGSLDRPTLPRASALVVAAMSYGASGETISQLPRGTDWILMALALTGVGTLGTTGAFGFAWAATIGRNLLPRIVFWIAIEGVIVLLAMVLLLQTEPSLAPERAAMLVAGSVSNVGLSQGSVAVTGSGLVILSVLMVVGRLLPLMVVGSWVGRADPKG